MSAETDKILRFLTEGVELSEGTIIIYNGGGGEQEVRTADDDMEVARSAASKKQVTINGKRWHFEVTRNEHGQITGLDVEQA